VKAEQRETAQHLTREHQDLATPAEPAIRHKASDVGAAPGELDPEDG
jgi:hypothetical protein